MPRSAGSFPPDSVRIHEFIKISSRFSIFSPAREIRFGFRSSVEILCYPPRGAGSGYVARFLLPQSGEPVGGGEAATGRESERRSTTETHRSAMNKMITKKNATSMILGGGKKKAAAKKTTPRKTGTVRQVRPRTRRRRWERRKKKNREQVSDATLSPFLSRPKGGVGYKKFEGRPLYLPDIEPPGERDTREAWVPKHDVYRRSRI